MAHGPATEWKEDRSVSYKAKLGLVMIAVFAIVYAIFILICVISPKTIANSVGSLNVAVEFGFGIIILAIIQALIYNFFCSRKEHEYEKADSGKGDDS
ncbi:MAG: hypothetical protein A2158_03340 [Chloroflexi bacterium RBG_13_46_14]|nr:MAG: hypothetical protein A2158_03340 [Chloroflexi bacterium RBG_13_46_14]